MRACRGTVGAVSLADGGHRAVDAVVGGGSPATEATARFPPADIAGTMLDMASGRKHPVHQPMVERFNEPVIVFLTVCTQDRKRVLASPDVVALLRDSWRDATSWLVGRFIILPDHLHLFCAPGEAPARPLGQWVRYWKTLASHRWPRSEEQPVWQLDFWDTQLRSIAHYDEKWEYVRQNPVRARLVADPAEWPHQGELNELRW